jgi:SAM-dependent methyltransferase
LQLRRAASIKFDPVLVTSWSPTHRGFLHYITSLASYDDFAWFYDRYWNEEFHSLAFPVLERIWLPRLRPGARILDVCCGTGYLAGLLCHRGYCVAGFDASPEMIRYARENVPAAEFQVCDAVEFCPSFHKADRFDGAVSTFDSLNHILESDALHAALRNVALALRPGAPFAFDMLLEDAYRTHWGEAFALVRDDHVMTITASGYDFRSRLASCTLTMFRLLDGAWQRADSVIHERCYTTEEIGAALTQAGFEQLACYSARDLGMAGQLGEGRTFFVAVRA